MYYNLNVFYTVIFTMNNNIILHRICSTRIQHLLYIILNYQFKMYDDAASTWREKRDIKKHFKNCYIYAMLFYGFLGVLNSYQSKKSKFH